MTEQVAYFLVAIGFILLLNLMAFVLLRVNYRSTNKIYLQWASLAVAIEALMQVPSVMLSLSPGSLPAMLMSFFLQFAASWVLLCAIIRKARKFNTGDKILLRSLLTSYVLGLAFSLINGFPQSLLNWIPVILPAVFTASAILWKIRYTEISTLPGRVLLVLCAISLVSIRVSSLIVDSTEMVYLLYYLDVLMFPILVSVLAFAEVENTHSRLNQLLSEKTRSEADLAFILDNSVDIILTVTDAGLLLTWNNRAENILGYTHAQTIRKVSIDDLFVGNYWHKNTDREQAFDAVMEHVDGKTFPVSVRMKTVVDDEQTHTIYVIKDKK
ncbi:MAG: PAS domain S-box-containing protein [Pseudohongiellaceae bacterium]